MLEPFRQPIPHPGPGTHHTQPANATPRGAVERHDENRAPLHKSYSVHGRGPYRPPAPYGAAHRHGSTKRGIMVRNLLEGVLFWLLADCSPRFGSPVVTIPFTYQAPLSRLQLQSSLSILSINSTSNPSSSSFTTRQLASQLVVFAQSFIAHLRRQSYLCSLLPSSPASPIEEHE